MAESFYYDMFTQCLLWLSSVFHSLIIAKTIIAHYSVLLHRNFKANRVQSKQLGLEIHRIYIRPIAYAVCWK